MTYSSTRGRFDIVSESSCSLSGVGRFFEFVEDAVVVELSVLDEEFVVLEAPDPKVPNTRTSVAGVDEPNPIVSTPLLVVLLLAALTFLASADSPATSSNLKSTSKLL